MTDSKKTKAELLEEIRRLRSKLESEATRPPEAGSRERPLAQQMALADLAKSGLSYATDLAATLRNVTERCARVTGVERVAVWRFSADGAAIHCEDRYERGLDRHERGDTIEVSAHPAYFRELGASDAIAAENARIDPRTSEFRETFFEPHGIVSVLDVPIFLHGCLAGVLSFEHVGEPRTWESSDRLFAIAVAGFLALAMEQSERKRTERALRESEQRLHRFVEDLPAGAAYVEGDRLFINRGAEQLTGYDRSEVETVDTWFDKLHPGRGPRARSFYDEERRRGFDRPVTVPIVRKDGSERLVEYTGFTDARVDVWLMRDVTHSDRSARLMEQTEHAARIGGWELDVRTGAVYWTRETYDIYEVSPESFTPTVDSAMAFLPVEDRTRAERSVRDSVVRGKSLELEVPLNTGKGRRILVRVVAQAEKRDAEVVKVWGSIQDVTERRRAEAERRESEDRFRQLTETISEVFWLTPPDKHRMLYVSPAYERIWGRTCDALYENPLTWMEAIAPEDRERVRLAAFEKQTRGEYDEEYRIIRPDGEIRWIRDRAFPVLDEQGNVVRIAGLAEDITSKKTAEEQIRRLSEELEQRVALRTSELYQSESRLRQIIDLVPHFIFAKDEEGRFILVNKAVADAYGTTVEQLLGKTDADFASSADEVRRFREDDLAVMRSGRAKFVVEEPITDARGRVRYLQTVKIPFLVSGSASPAVLGVSTDISDRKRAEKERAELELQLRRAQKMEAIGTLAGGIAHDFNNILTAILGYADILESSLSADPKAREKLGEILLAGHRAKDLVSQILTFSRQQEQRRAVTRLQPTIAEALRLLRAAIPTTIEIRSEVDPDTPAVLADSTRIHQVVMNLATNAAAAMENRSGILEVRLGPVDVDAEFAWAHPDLRPARYVRLSVSDTGHGMDEATLERIFEPFFTTKGPAKGTGLGLSVVHGIVKDHDGAILVRSTPGQGTVFDLYLPAVADAQPDAQEALRTTPRGAGQRLLCVDDERPIAELLKAILDSLGYETVIHTVPTEALEAFRSRPAEFDLVITDLAMPVLNGLDFARELLKIRPGLPIILSTGFSGDVTEDLVQDMGLRKLLLKPFSVQQLGLAVHDALASRS